MSKDISVLSDRYITVFTKTLVLHEDAIYFELAQDSGFVVTLMNVLSDLRT
jgi:hypothetical protein